MEITLPDSILIPLADCFYNLMQHMTLVQLINDIKAVLVT